MQFIPLSLGLQIKGLCGSQWADVFHFMLDAKCGYRALNNNNDDKIARACIIVKIEL